jgi:hypothetical protein
MTVCICYRGEGGREAREFLENSKVAYDSLIGSLGQWLRVLEASDGASVSEVVTRSLWHRAIAGHHASSGASVSSAIGK